MMVGSVSEHFANLPQQKRCETYVSSLNALLQGTEVSEMVWPQNHPFHSIIPKMMVGSVLKHFANIRDVKICKTSVLGLNALFRRHRCCENGFVRKASIALH
jgi:hypothetical protein